VAKLALVGTIEIVYRDAAAFDAHRRGPSLARWRERTTGMILKFSVTRCTPVESEAVART